LTVTEILDTNVGFESIRGPVIIFSLIFTPISRFNQSKIYKRVEFVSINRSIQVCELDLQWDHCFVFFPSSRSSEMDYASPRQVSKLFLAYYWLVCVEFSDCIEWLVFMWELLKRLGSMQYFVLLFWLMKIIYCSKYVYIDEADFFNKIWIRLK